MRRTLVALLVGIVIGVVGTFTAVEISGGWYTYFTLPAGRCERANVGDAQVVPNQPNPCHFRERRWSLIN